LRRLHRSARRRETGALPGDQPGIVSIRALGGLEPPRGKLCTPCASAYSFLSRFLLHGRQSLKAMKESDDGKKLILEFWKLTISSQIGMLEAMANALDNFPKDMQGSCLREMYKANAAFMTLYFRAIEQVGDQLVHMQSDALRRSSEALRAVLSKMDQADASPKPEAKAS